MALRWRGFLERKHIVLFFLISGMVFSWLNSNWGTIIGYLLLRTKRNGSSAYLLESPVLLLLNITVLASSLKE